MARTGEIEEQLRAFSTVQNTKFSIKEPVLSEFLTICSELNLKKDFDVSTLLDKFERLE
jgi:hypothetical protein